MKRAMMFLILGILLIFTQGCSEVDAQKSSPAPVQAQTSAPAKTQQSQKSTPSAPTNQKPVQVKEVLLSSSEIVFGDGGSENTYNAKVALKALNGKIIGAGQIFSYNQVVGERTKAKGYINGYDAKNNIVLGGGVCRTATLVFQAALDGKMEIVERHPHVPAVHYAAPGRDATVAYGSLDFRFRNTSGSQLKIYGSIVDKGGSSVLGVKLVKLVEVK